MSGDLDMQITYGMIVVAARERRVLHYTDIADAHGIEWSPAVFRHLGKVLEVSFKRDWPALTAIIVPAGTDHLSGKGLKGFCDSAKRAGYEFDDCATFAREQMEAVFDWAQTADTEFAIERDGDKDGTGGKVAKEYKGDHGDDGFDIRITYRMIVAAARKRRVLHYTEITDAHDMEMNQVLNQLFSHLDEVLKISFERDWPALTAIIVPVRTDHLAGKGLRGFCDSAGRAGYEFDDCATFAREQMEAVFDWAPTAGTEFEPTNGGSKDSSSPTGTNSAYLTIIGLISIVGVAAYYSL